MDLNSYLQWVEKVQESIQFFSQNSAFKSSASSLKKLKELSNQAMVDCQTEFERLIMDYSKVIDIRKVGLPLPTSFGINLIISVVYFRNYSI